MRYINCGAFINGERPRTKKALKEAIIFNPASVQFDKTSMYEAGAVVNTTEIPEDAVMQVVGPDPYNKRNWYANVLRSSTGNLGFK